MKQEDIISLAIALAGPMIGGQISGLACIKDVTGPWYNKLLKKPKWTPPNWLFGGMWPILYVGQSVASWLVWKNKGANHALPLGLYAVQLVLNLAWQPIFFKAHRPDIALADSSAVLGLAAAATVFMTRAAGSQNAKIAVASLMTPYVAWVAFATALTAQIWKDNPNANKSELHTYATPHIEGTTRAASIVNNNEWTTVEKDGKQKAAELIPSPADVDGATKAVQKGKQVIDKAVDKAKAN